MTSELLKNFLENPHNHEALKMPNKKQKINPAKRKQDYIVKKNADHNIKVDLDKIINPISQEILNKVIKLKKRKYRISVKSNFDNKKYIIEITIPKR
jgi:hypothetical protein